MNWSWRGLRRNGRARVLKFLMLSSTTLLFAGCAGPDPVRFLSPRFLEKAPSRVAVLPFDNESLDLAGPQSLRKMVDSGLRRLGFDTIGLEQVDVDLRELGITDGGQLRALAPKSIGEALGAGGLFYGVVEDFAFFNVGFAVRRVVCLRLRLVLPGSGEVLWEDTGRGLTERLTLKRKQAGRAFVEGLLERGWENAWRAPLLPESEEAVRNLLRRLPGPAVPPEFGPAAPKPASAYESGNGGH